MHLLAAQAGALQEEGEAIDLGQTPGDYVFASSADSELAMLAAAADRAGEDGLRLASLMRLTHNFSVDLWCEQTLAGAKLIVIRLIGGAAYWPYGCDEIETLARDKGIALAFLPGDAVPDPILLQRSTVAPAAWYALHALFCAGGPDAADAALRAFRDIAAGRPVSAPRAPLPAFGVWQPGRGLAQTVEKPSRPAIPILFYRALLEGAGTATLEALIEGLDAAGLAPVPIAISSLKASDCAGFVQETLEALSPAAILNLTGFALGLDGLPDGENPFAGTDAPVIQLVQGSRPQALWAADPRGLTAKDLAMQIVLPELDGRIGGLLVGHKADAVWHARTQCPLTSFAPEPDGIARAVALAKNYARLRQTPRQERRIGLVLANYPLRDGRIANGVGYDAPQSTVAILRILARAGYDVTGIPDDGAALIAALQAGPTNARPGEGISDAILPINIYRDWLADLPAEAVKRVTARWGGPEVDPFVRDGGFHLPVHRFGAVAILLQPARAYDLDDAESFHDPDLVPPHAYLAAYLWLRHGFGAHALIHNGKHGNLEWLPGKASALDSASFPSLLWGQLPHFYPFIVNDPGEGTQAKRRTGATIIDHLVPPLTRAQTYGPLAQLEALLDEYYLALGMDQRRLADLRRTILDCARDARLDTDLGLPADDDDALRRIDTFLCELKESQIRDGLHVFGQSPQRDLARDLLLAFARVPRGDGEGANASLIAALAHDLALGVDPLALEPAAPWTGPKPEILAIPGVWRSAGDTVERLETLAAALGAGRAPDPHWNATRAVLNQIETVIAPRLARSGPSEIAALLDGLDGKFIAPGPAGAPSRGRIDTLPTGRNFYAVDNRAIPTPTAWALGQKAADALLTRHFHEHGAYPRALVMSVWGTATMRTGGDDVAHALALIGARPVWQGASHVVTGYEIVPLARLGRPRVDVTLRISGLFRDAFPAQIALFDRAIRAIGALDEPEDDNPIAARMRAEALGLMADGESEADAALAAGHRIFGPAPGAYGAGVGKLVETGAWTGRDQLVAAVLDSGGFAYSARAEGLPARAHLANRLARTEAVVQAQDNAEHDLLDSDQYYQFEGGLVGAVEALSGRRPAAWHLDTARPDTPRVRALEEEIGRVMRARVVNPKWIAGVMRHGYRGAFEIVATVDFMLGFAATSGAVRSHHFDMAFAAFIKDDAVRDFLATANRAGYDELIARFAEARDRGFWTPRSNSANAVLEGSQP